MKIFKRTTRTPSISAAAIFFLAIFIVSPSTAEVSARAQAIIDEGLDAIGQEDYPLAAEKLSTAVDNLRNGSDFPIYLLYNLALATDKIGETPLRAAAYYRAYLAAESEPQNKKEIERRIKDLEKRHLSYVEPLCEAAVGMVGLIEYVIISNLIQAQIDVLAACATALVYVGEESEALKLEKKYRKGIFPPSYCSEEVILNAALSVGFYGIGTNSKSDQYGRKARAGSAAENCSFSGAPLFMNNFPNVDAWLDHKIKSIDSHRSWRDGWRSSKTEYVVDAFRESFGFFGLGYLPSESFWKPYQPSTSFVDSTWACANINDFAIDPLPSPLVDLSAFVAYRDKLPDYGGDVTRAGNYACAALQLARFWRDYQWEIEYWDSMKR